MNLIRPEDLPRPEPQTLRLWLSVLWLSLVPGRLSGFWSMAPSVMGLAALAALFGPFMARLLLIYAARDIEAALTSLVNLLSPVFTLVLGWLLFRSLPTTLELVGGLVVMVGTMAALGPRRGAA